MSAERARPWWASEGPDQGAAGVPRGRPVGGPVRHVDETLERHRQARRAGVPGDRGGPGAEPAPWWSSRASGQDTRASDQDTRESDRDPPPREAASHRVEACGVCPFCTSLRLLQDTRPELVEHLTEAARHLAAAARSLLETPVPDRPERTAGAGPADGRLQRIRLDGETDSEGPPL
jgi:hypothetical protein